MYNQSVEGIEVFLFANRRPLPMANTRSLDKNRQNIGSGLLRVGDGMTSGIYAITNKINGHRYIGSAVNVQKRWNNHRSSLRSGKHHSIHLQNAWNKYGESAFVFDILQKVLDKNDLVGAEQEFIDSLRPEYNITPRAGSTLGIKHGPGARANMVASHIGKRLSEETRAKMSAAGKGRIPTDAARANMSAAQKGRIISAEHIAKLSESHKGKPSPRKGCVLSEETRAKISVAQIGRIASAETRAKIGAKCKGENSSTSKLTWSQVEEIRSRYIPRKVSQRKLAKEYGVDQQVIWSIVNNKTWRVE